MLKGTQNHIFPTKIQYTASYALQNSSKIFNKKQLQSEQKQIASQNTIQLAMV